MDNLRTRQRAEIKFALCILKTHCTSHSWVGVWEPLVQPGPQEAGARRTLGGFRIYPSPSHLCQAQNGVDICPGSQIWER